MYYSLWLRICDFGFGSVGPQFYRLEIKILDCLGFHSRCWSFAKYKVSKISFSKLRNITMYGQLKKKLELKPWPAYLLLEISKAQDFRKPLPLKPNALGSPSFEAPSSSAFQSPLLSDFVKSFPK